MIKERKEKLIRHLYPTTEYAKFMLNDLYVELLDILPKKICFGNDNLTNKNREENLVKARGIVAEFLNENLLYRKKIEFEHNTSNFTYLVDLILYGYVLYLTPHINYGSGADVFLDKRSVCYCKRSILDLL